MLDTSNVNYFSGAWSGCTGLTEFPAIDTSSAVSLYQSWNVCSSLTEFPWIDTSSGPDIRYAWKSCSSLTSFPTIDTSSCTSFDQTWMNCSGLTAFPLLDTSSCTDFRNAWQGCSGLTTFPSLNLSSGTRFAYAWAFCSSLTDFPANLFDNCTTQFDNFAFNNTWLNCTSLTSTSVENILNSISVSAASGTPPTSGTGISISYNASSGTPDITVPAVDLIAKGWIPTLNGSSKTDPYSSDFATLDLDFATNLSLTDNISGNNLVTFTRNSIGTYVDSNGVIQTADIDTPRFDHDPDTLESLGLLVEEARTNISTYSEIASTWGGIGGQTTNVSSNVTDAPDGNTTADLIYGASGNWTALSLQGGTSLNNNWWIIASVFVKKVPGSKYGFINLNVNAAGSGGPRINLNLDTGETITYGDVSGYAIPFPNGWYRLVGSVRNTSGATQTAPLWNANSIRIFAVTTNTDDLGVGTGTGSTTDGVYVWGRQVEKSTGGFVTSYIPTDGTAGGITRVAEQVSVTGTNFSSWYNQIGGTLVTNSRVYPLPLNYTQRPYCAVIMNSNGSQYWGQTWENCGDGKVRVDTTAGAQDSNTGLNLQTDEIYNTSYKSALGVEFSGDVNVNGIGKHSNQGLTVTNVSVPKNTAFVDRLTFGTSINGNGQTGIWQGHISRLTYWPKRLTDTSLQYLTQ